MTFASDAVPEGMQTAASCPQGRASQLPAGLRLRQLAVLIERSLWETSTMRSSGYNIDHVRLARAYADWLADCAAPPVATHADGDVAAGMLLCHLLRQAPLRLAFPATRDSHDPASYWPEACVYAHLCLDLRTSFSGQCIVTDRISDIRNWWSFRENVAMDPHRAILFMGLLAPKNTDTTPLGADAQGEK